MQTGVAGAAVNSQIVEVGMESSKDVTLFPVFLQVRGGWCKQMRSIPDEDCSLRLSANPNLDLDILDTERTWLDS